MLADQTLCPAPQRRFAGTAVGWALGLATHTLFYIVVPIMGGGVGEGALPLSLGYATITHQPKGIIFATILPAVMLGSLTAIIFAGALNYIGKRNPHLTGEGRLQPASTAMRWPMPRSPRRSGRPTSRSLPPQWQLPG